jgi:polyribonucleotide nucleotidyltransferase
VLSIDDRGKVKLSMRGIDQETGEQTPVEPRPPRPPRPIGEAEPQGERQRRDRGPRRHRRAG